MTDVVHLDVPLFIRLIELAREEVKQDADLHDIAEKVISISQQRVATMADYDSIVSFMKSPGEPAAASEPKEEFTAEDTDTEFDDNYEDYSDWLEELDNWDTDTIEAQEYSWDVVPEGLSSIIEDNDFEDEDEEEFDD